ncbi:uncharacterized protein LOC120067657 [Benincasa hispida]|uniref:uncharacterized protein LOC120067657 n=1 Tax=Benincasa hispida TaxID=102211 RepID=UPI001901B68C|nr:uncharacterized protein LOC120067657 [Benincasa hispida]
MGLPKYAAFKSEKAGKYLQYLHEGPIKGNLQYSSDNVANMFSKFTLEPSKTSNYVNIRCCYNNKFWASSNDDNHMITPSLSKPAENEFLSPCTLFRIVKAPAEGAYYLLDVLRQSYVCRCTTSKIHENCLTTRYGNQDHYYDRSHILIDFETIVMLPKHVAFKCDIEKYLCNYWYENHEYLKFDSDDIGFSKVGHQVFNVGDGSIRIKCDHSNKFWVRQPNNWILANSTDTTTNNKDTLFWPVKVSKNVVALRNLGNNSFCKRFTHENKEHCLSAHSNTISREAQLEIVEPIISREIYNCKYRTMDARVYDEKVLNMATGEATNGATKETSMAVSLKYVVETSKCWESSVTAGWGVTTSIKAGIPEIAEAGIEINYNEEKSHTWGETITEMKEVMVTYTVSVPAKTRMKVTLLGTKAKCDVPFSYTRRDVQRDGKQVITDCDDGLYVGVNSYKFDYQNKPLPL